MRMIIKLFNLKNPSAPYVTERRTYDILKADMLGNLQFSQVKVKMYFEDEIGSQVFSSLMDAYQYVLERVKNGSDKALRHPEEVSDFQKINERIRNVECALECRNKTTSVVTHMGCDELLKVYEADPYFKRIIFMLDGDSRLVKNKPHIRDFLDNYYDVKKHGQTERKHDPNIMFAPDFFCTRILFV